MLDLDRSLDRLRALDECFGGRFRTAFATAQAVESRVVASDLVIGTVLVPGALAPKLVSRAMLGRMRRGSVLVDISIDQGGCFETSRPTTHQDPVYTIDGCALLRRQHARRGGEDQHAGLANATLPYVQAIADRAWAKDCPA